MTPSSRLETVRYLGKLSGRLKVTDVVVLEVNSEATQPFALGTIRGSHRKGLSSEALHGGDLSAELPGTA